MNCLISLTTGKGRQFISRKIMIKRYSLMWKNYVNMAQNHGKAFLYLVWNMTLILFCLNIKQHTYACAHTLKHTNGFSDEQKYVKIKQKLESLWPLLSLYISEKMQNTYPRWLGSHGHCTWFYTVFKFSILKSGATPWKQQRQKKNIISYFSYFNNGNEWQIEGKEREEIKVVIGS